jgi:hypothetical protein
MTTLSDTTQRAAKAHRCDHCGHSVAIGERYRRSRDQGGTFRGHADCAKVADRVRREEGHLCDVRHRNASWIKAEYPMVAERLKL